MEPESPIRTILAREIAARWVADNSQREYRFSVFGFARPSDARKAANLLRSWRDLKTKVSGLGEPGPQVGLRTSGDGFELWSSDPEVLRRVARWAESNGWETDFIW